MSSMEICKYNYYLLSVEIVIVHCIEVILYRFE